MPSLKPAAHRCPFVVTVFSLSFYAHIFTVGCFVLPSESFAQDQDQAQATTLESDALGTADGPEFSISGAQEASPPTETPAQADEVPPVAVAEKIPAAAPLPLANPQDAPPPNPAPNPALDTRTLKERHREMSKHSFALGVIFSYKAYRLADWRAAPVDRTYRSPRFMTLLLNMELPVLHLFGVTSLYSEAGVGGNFNKDGFNHLSPALIILNLGLSYRGRFVPRQWVVPYIKGAAEGVRHAFHFNSARIAGYRIMPRVEGGLELFLNALDRSTAGDMYGNNKVVRTYFTGGYSMTFDNKKNDFNLSDRALRFGIKVEF